MKRSTFWIAMALMAISFTSAQAEPDWLINCKWSRDNCDVPANHGCWDWTPTDPGVLMRRCDLVKTAIEYAKKGQHDQAFYHIWLSQCHNDGAQKSLEDNRNDVIAWLIRGAPDNL